MTGQRLLRCSEPRKTEIIDTSALPPGAFVGGPGQDLIVDVLVGARDVVQPKEWLSAPSCSIRVPNFLNRKPRVWIFQSAES